MTTLVLLPGMDGTGELFAEFAEAAQPHFSVRIVRYPPAEPMDYAGLEAVARSSLPTQGRFILVGESFSGPIAISLAAAKPPGLVGLVLCATFARNPYPVLRPLHRLATAVPLRAAPRPLLHALLMGGFSTFALQRTLARALTRVEDVALRARLAAILRVDVTDKLAAITIPTLYLQGSHDRLVPPAAAALIGRSVPHMDVARIEAPHFVLQVAPQAALRLMREFADACRFGRGHAGVNSRGA